MAVAHLTRGQVPLPLVGRGQGWGYSEMLRE